MQWKEYTYWNQENRNLNINALLEDMMVNNNLYILRKEKRKKKKYIIVKNKLLINIFMLIC